MSMGISSKRKYSTTSLNNFQDKKKNLFREVFLWVLWLAPSSKTNIPNSNLTRNHTSKSLFIYVLFIHLFISLMSTLAFWHGAIN